MRTARERRDELLAIYAQAERSLPPRDCTRSTGCCRFSLTGREPHVTQAELDLLLEHVAASGRRIPPHRSDGACPFLAADETTCTVYDARPFGCRTHFCRAAGGAVPARELRDSLRRLAQLDEELGSDARGSRPLTRALRDGAVIALRQRQPKARKPARG
ncbi:MAG TPA: YkgJ family cysteine cluster protein [Candidatus Limnocylindrales bacterium]|nr:YkgJ family cysteine cluster protein [Candidatus Limnocylindrales bacterium]